MKTASIADLKTKLSGCIKASQAGPVVITKYAKLVAVLLSIQYDDELERLLMAYSPKLQRILRKPNGSFGPARESNMLISGLKLS